MQGLTNSSVDVSRITTFVFDMDGVLWRGKTAIDGAAQAVKRLKDAGRKCLFCTNNSSRTKADYLEKLRDFGLEVDEDEIFTSSWVTAHYLSGHFTGPFLAYVLGEKGIRSELKSIGARIVNDVDVDEQTNVDCVVVGMDRSVTYEKLHNAQRLIRKGALFIATNRDGSFPVEGGEAPGSGSIVAAVEAASGITPVTVGKPRSVMIDLARQRFNLELGEMAMVGDRLDTDILCARRAGIAAICVTTGVTTLEKAEKARGELRPHCIYENLDQLWSDALEEAPQMTELSEEELPSKTEEAEVAVAAVAETAQPKEEPAAVKEADFSIEDQEAKAEPELVEEPQKEPAAQVQEPTAEEEPQAEEKADTSWTEDMDELFEEAKEPPKEETSDEPAAEDEEEHKFDFDTAMSISTDDQDAEQTKEKEPAAKSDEEKASRNGKKESDEAFDWKLD